MSIHVTPVEDEREHDLVVDCWCEPRVLWLDPDTNLPWASGLGPQVLHNAADCREMAEIVTGEALAPGLGWKITDEDGNEFEES